MKVIGSIFAAALLMLLVFLLGEVNLGRMGTFKFFSVLTLSALLTATYGLLIYSGFVREFGSFSAQNLLRFFVSIAFGSFFVGVGVLSGLVENDFYFDSSRMNWAGIFMIWLLIGGAVFNSQFLKEV